MIDVQAKITQLAIGAAVVGALVLTIYILNLKLDSAEKDKKTAEAAVTLLSEQNAKNSQELTRLNNLRTAEQEVMAALKEKMDKIAAGARATSAEYEKLKGVDNEVKDFSNTSVPMGIKCVLKAANCIQG